MKKMLLLQGWILIFMVAGTEAMGTEIDFAIPAIDTGPELSLSQALQVADNRNLSLAVFRSDLAQAQAKLKSTWALLIPSAHANMNYQYNDHADTVRVGGAQTIETRRQDSLSGQIQIKVPLINVRQWWQVSAAVLEKELAELKIEKVRQLLLLSVAQAYFQSLTLHALIKVQTSQLEATKHHYSVARLRYQSGTGRRLDLVRAETEILTTKEELLKAHTALSNSRDALSTLLDMSVMPMPKAGEPLDMEMGTESEMIDTALKQREDVQVGKKTVAWAIRQLNGWWMQFFPTLNGLWQYTQQITEPSSFGSQDPSRWFIGLNLSIPLYDQLRYAEVEQLQAAKIKAETEQAQNILTVKQEIRTARRAYKDAKTLVRSAIVKARLAQESLLLSENAYQAGTGSSLEVTDAQRLSRGAEIDLAVKRLQSQLTQLGLMRAVGEDLSKL